MKFILATARLLLASAIFGLGLAAGTASAQDLTLNISDTNVGAEGKNYDPIPAGGTIHYQVRIDNGGNSRTPAAGTVEFTIPEGATYEGMIFEGVAGGLTNCTAPPVPGLPDGQATVTCDFPSLAPRERVEGILLMTPAAEGTVELAARIDGTNISETETTTVTKGADLELEFDPPETVKGGEFLKFTATITNNGPDANTGGKFSMMLPDALSSDIEPPAGCEIAGRQVTCTLADQIPVGSSVSFPFTSQVLTDDESTVTISGSITGARPGDPISTNDTAKFDVSVEPGTDVTLRKDRSPSGLLYVGQEITFTLTPAFSGTVPLEATITDDLPSNYKLVGVAGGGGWSCNNANPVECAYSSANADPAGFRTPITITARAAEKTTASVTNTAEIDSPGDVWPANNTASDLPADIVEPATDLVAHKSGPRHGLVKVGNEYDWKIWATNDRPKANIGFAGRLVLTEIVPEGLEVISITPPTESWECDSFTSPLVGNADGTVRISCWTDEYTEENPLKVGAKTPELIITAKATEEGHITNTARVDDEDATYPDADLSNNETSTGVTAGDGETVGIADLSLSKTVTSTGPYESGDPVTFEIRVMNTGPDPAMKVRLTDRLDALYFADHTTTGVTLDAVPEGMSCTVTRGGGYYSDLSCDIEELPRCGVEDAPACPVLTFTATAGGDAGVKRNSAEVYSITTPDPDDRNNTASADYEVLARTDVTIEKTASHEPDENILAGHELIYVLSAIVPRNGLSAAENVTVTDHLPAGLRIAGVTPSAGSCDAMSGLSNGITTESSQLSCNLGRIGNGNQQTVTIRAIPTTGLVGKDIVNNATVTTTTTELDSDNNSDAISHHIIQPKIDLITNKTDTVDPLELGSETDYIVTVRNNGPSEAFNLKIKDILPTKGLSFQSVSPKTAGLTCDTNGVAVDQIGGTLTCNMVNLPVGKVAEFHVTMKAEARGRHVNEAKAESAEYPYETQTANNEVKETTSVFERADLEVTKQVSKSPVDLGEPFDWTITVRNLDSDGIGLAENVELKDTLPENMEFDGDIVTTVGECVKSGNRSFTCYLLDMERGDRIDITVPTRVVAVSSKSETRTNSATASTDSFDRNQNNNTGKADVTVHSTEVSGTIWHDFNNNDRRDENDSGAGNVTVELTGTDKWGREVTLPPTTTDSEGRYSFGLLPPGEYRVSYINPDDDRYHAGNALPGIGGGNAFDANTIADITATTSEPAVDNDFTLIPQARLALAKHLAVPVLQKDDGSYLLTYTFRVKNESLEPVKDFALVDDFLSPFGAYTSDTAPGHGEFAVTSITGATLTSGADAQLHLASAGPLAAGQTHKITMVLRVNPEFPRVAASQPFTNRAEITGTGEWSEQTPSDKSNNGSTPRHNVESNTSRTVDFSPAIELEKTAEVESSPTGVSAGDIVRYTFTITNTGQTPLENVELEDPLPNLVWEDQAPIPLLMPGASDNSSYKAHYVLTQDDIENGSVKNTATAKGRWAVDGVTDPFVSDEDTAEALALAEPVLEVVKREVSNTVQDPTEVGDTIRYEFTVTNRGNIDLHELVLTDRLPGIVADPAGSFTIGTLKIGESTTLHADYSVTQADIDAGEVVNIAEVSGHSGRDQNPIDSESEEVTVLLFQKPGMRVTKILDGDVPENPRAGDQISWLITIENTGNTSLEIGSIDEPLADTSVSAAVPAVIAPGESATATATHTLSQAEIDVGEVINQVTVSGKVPGSNTPFPEAPSGNDPDNPNEDKTITPLPAVPSIALLKELVTDVSVPLMPEDEIEFAFTIKNTGNVTLENLVLVDDIPEVVLDTASLEGVSLAPKGEVTVTGTYKITAEDLTAGGLTNTAIVTGTDPHGTDVDDKSGTSFDNDDPTPVDLVGRPGIALVKLLDTEIDKESLTLGDEIRWVFEVHNTGNVTLTNVTIAEEMVDATVSGGPITLEPGESDIDSFTASYVITQADLDAGRVENQAIVTGYHDHGSGDPTPVTDKSGTTVDDDDPTVTTLGQNPEIDLVKRADDSQLSSPPQAGDKVHYSFTITNTGDVTLTDVTLTDEMQGLELSGSPIPSLAPGQANDTAYSAIYTLTQEDIDSGRALENQAKVEGTYNPPSGDPKKVDDVSGTETGTDTPTIVELDRKPELKLEKTADDSALTEPAEPGQEIIYTFTVTNTGNVTLTDVTVDDPLPGLELSGNPIASLAPGESSDAITGTYALTEDDIIATEVRNTAQAKGIWDPEEGPSESVPSNDSSVTVNVGYPEIDFDISIGELRDLDGDGRMGPGDEVVFHFEVHNTGTVPLHNVNVDKDTLSVPLPGLSCTPISLAVGESAFLTCTGAGHIITKEDAERGEITQKGDATGTSDMGVVVRASSEAATLTNIAAGGLTLEKVAGFETVMIGDLVPYTIRITNAPEGVPVTTRVVDTLPTGFTYRAESARLDGEKVELAENGRKLTLEPVEVAPGQTRELTLQARVGGSVRPGSYDNRVQLISPLTGREIAPEAKATVRVLADPVLQCATVIGRVFDDVDQNGHMSKSAEERGLPNIRLIAPNGLAILTDEHGRYNVPCAALPRAIGSNFMLKLDERTLPTNYRLTTENPRVVRLTPGMITRLDFGATLARLVRVDLAANSFNGAGMTPALEAGLNQLVTEISGQVTMLRITYLQAPHESEADARQRTATVERHLRDLWSREGKYKLNIETLIQRGGDAK